jgi:superfamily II DNA or RNA helicase
VQSLRTAEASLNDLLASGRWLIACDEFHRYAAGNSWGDSVRALNGVFTLAVSATPDRTDGAEKAILGEPDVKVTLNEAVEEGAIRPIKVHACEYSVDITTNETDHIRLSTGQLLLELESSPTDITAAAVRKDLRFHSKYVQKLLSESWACLTDKNGHQEGQHKMIVFTLGIQHAKHLAECFNNIAGYRTADWIAVQSHCIDDEGKSKTLGRTEQDNERVLGEFKTGKIQILCQVSKATEGFNEPKASVLVFANTIRPSVKLKQMLGRGLRRNFAIEPSHEGRAETDICDVFVSTDHPSIDYLTRLEAEMTPDEEEPIDGGGGGGGGGGPEGPIIFDIPDFYIIDAQYEGEKLFYPLGGDEKVEVSEAIAIARQHQDMKDAPEESVVAMLNKYFKAEPAPASTMEKINNTKARIDGAVKSFANNVVRWRFKDQSSIPNSVWGDAIKAIHTHYKRQVKMSTSEMDVTELLEKYAWVKDLNQNFKQADDRMQFLKELAPWILL